MVRLSCSITAPWSGRGSCPCGNRAKSLTAARLGPQCPPSEDGTTEVGQRGPIGPRQPILRIRGGTVRMAIQLGEAIEGIGPAEFARVDQAHEDVAHVRAMAGLVEVGVLAIMQSLALWI